ncbi:MAG: hypothetical protein Q9M50_14305 [Methylococcales bacterium]|nr:hypothetical protein [Methylococcales bacterium]
MSFIKALQAKRDEVGTHQLSHALGLSESTIRVICNGHYKGSLEVITGIFNQIYNNDCICEFTQEIIDRTDCSRRASAPRPFGGATKQAWWETCQSCELNKGN